MNAFTSRSGRARCARLMLFAGATMVGVACADDRTQPRADAAPSAGAPPSGASVAGASAPRAANTTVSSADENGTLDVGSWNIEWFGDPSNGPENDAMQLANATVLLRTANVDIWGLAEIVDEGAWSRLVASMEGYTGVLASDRIVTDGRRHYAPSEQKLAVLFRSATMSMRGARVILTGFDGDFAGRPPLEVRLRDKASPDQELILIVVHMKARNDRASWQRRTRASRALKEYLDRTYPDAPVIVVGDWNDGLDRSITGGEASPYADFVRDGSHYRFTSQALAERGQSSTTDYGTMVDHHLVSNELADREVPGSAEVRRPGGVQRNFRSTTSDHFPVVSHFRSLRP